MNTEYSINAGTVSLVGFLSAPILRSQLKFFPVHGLTARVEVFCLDVRIFRLLSSKGSGYRHLSPGACPDSLSHALPLGKLEGFHRVPAGVHRALILSTLLRSRLQTRVENGLVNNTGSPFTLETPGCFTVKCGHVAGFWPKTCEEERGTQHAGLTFQPGCLSHPPAEREDSRTYARTEPQKRRHSGP